MTRPTRLDEINERLRAASPYPWHYATVDSIGGGGLYDTTRVIASLHYEQPDEHDGRIVRHLLKHEADANGDFIAHAPTDLADLLAFARKIRYIYDGPESAEEAMDLISNELNKLENS